MPAPDVQEIPGWLTQAEANALHVLASGRRCLEVGSFCGRSSVAIGTAAASLHCVDPFDGRGTPIPGDTLHRFRRTLAEFKLSGQVSYTPATVEDFAAVTGKRLFDFVFIDGEHTAAALSSNLEAVHRLTSPGGVVAIHDYDNPQYPGVKAVADGVFQRAPEMVVDSLAVYLMDGPFPGRLLNVVTPCMRPDNVPKLRSSLEALAADLPGWALRWYVYFDRNITYVPEVDGAYLCGRQSPGGASGNPGRNDALDAIRNGWVWFLDDDNDVHPDFATGLRSAVVEYPDASGYVFPQYFPNNSLRLSADAQAAYGSIDTAQFLFHRKAIGSTRWDMEDYAADAGFFRDVSAAAGHCVPILSGGVYYNKLR